MEKIFISYRREDSALICGRIYEELAGRFGSDNIFKDIDSIELGVPFQERIDDSIRQCRVQLVIISDKWLDITDKYGKRRLDNKNDPVRLEIEAALRRRLRVIPVIIDDAEYPRQDHLPRSIRRVAGHNGARVRTDRHFANDMKKLSTH